jgi:hypothetical protein
MRPLPLPPRDSSSSSTPASQGATASRHLAALSSALLHVPTRRRVNRKRPAAGRRPAGPSHASSPVPLAAVNPEVQSYRDPWTVRSVRDLFTIYLPEISLSAGAVIGSGFLASKIYRRWIIDALPFVAPATYAAALGVVLGSIYIRGKFYPSPITRARIRFMLLASLLLLGFHAAAHLVLRAAI